MEGLKEALEYVVGLNTPHYTEDEMGRAYSDKPMYMVQKSATAETIKLTTLGSLVVYLLNKGDEHKGELYVHVEQPDRVRLLDTVCRRDDYKRNNFVTVTADIPVFPFGQFMAAEEFIIKVKSMFQDMPVAEGQYGKTDILLYAGNVQNGSVKTCIDDGVTQHAEIKTGILNTENLIAPSIVVLKPFRTFLEVEQPESEFLFRMKQNRDGEVMCALFEADGFLWKNRAKASVAEYLAEMLKANENIIILC